MIAPLTGRVMTFGYELVWEAFANLRARAQRSALALLGIIIGTAAVVAMLTIGHNAEREAARQFGEMGVDLISVQQSNTGTVSVRLDPNAIESLPDRQPTIIEAAPISLGFSEVRAGSAKAQGTVIGATPSLGDMLGLATRDGRFISPIDQDGTFVVLGHDLARQLSAPGRPMAPGRQVAIGPYMFTVVGVLQKSRPVSMLPLGLDQVMILPLAGARRIVDPGANGAFARMRPGADDVAASAAVSADLTQYARGAEVRVQSARQLVEALKRQMAVNTRLLAAIGGISLLVGGVGAPRSSKAYRHPPSLSCDVGKT